jgi:hypothetical protein
LPELHSNAGRTVQDLGNLHTCFARRQCSPLSLRHANDSIEARGLGRTAHVYRSKEAGRLRNQRVFMANALPNTEYLLMDAFCRPANHFSLGQIYPCDIPLLKRPLTKEHIKPRILDHWGYYATTRFHVMRVRHDASS